jgi:hypothetical protein
MMNLEAGRGWWRWELSRKRGMHTRSLPKLISPNTKYPNHHNLFSHIC